MGHCSLVVGNFTSHFLELFSMFLCLELEKVSASSSFFKIHLGPQSFELPHRERVDLAFIYSEQHLKNRLWKEPNSVERQAEWELVERKNEREFKVKF